MKQIDPTNGGENSSLLANVGLDIVQTSIDLNHKMNEFIQEHEKWKAEDSRRKKELDDRFLAPTLASTNTKVNPHEKLRAKLIEQQNNCENCIKEFADHKNRMKMAQKQKIEMDVTLETYKKQLDAINASKRVVSPLNEIQNQLQLEERELSRVLQGVEEPNKEQPLTEDNRINKILADLNEDMKELNDLLY